MEREWNAAFDLVSFHDYIFEQLSEITQKLCCSCVVFR